MYHFSDENRLQTPHSYMYVPFQGREFLNAYVLSRQRHLKKHASEPWQIKRTRQEIEKDLILAAKFFGAKRPFHFFTEEEPVQLKILLGTLLNLLSIGDLSRASFWLSKVIQRFEVSKKLYQYYLPGFRKGQGDALKVDLYVEFAFCAALAYVSSKEAQYLSTLLKLIDLLISLEAGDLDSCCSGAQLALLVEVELNAVSALAKSVGVRFDEF